MKEEQMRTALLLGEEAITRLADAHVIVFGIGGVGGHAVDALVRAGIGEITLVDNDTVSLSNINRQLIALHSAVGRDKVDVMAERIRDIDPDVTVHTKKVFYSPENADDFNLGAYDYVVDAIDSVPGKIELAVRAERAGTPIISSMGAGNKLDPTAFRVADIYKTSVCPLARAMRTALRQRGVKKLKVVYSEETPKTMIPQGDRPVPGSVSFVPSVVGLILAGEVIKDLSGNGSL